MAQPPYVRLVGLGACLATVGAASAVSCASSTTGVCTPGGLGLPFFAFALLIGGLLSVILALVLYVAGSGDLLPGALRARVAGFSAWCPSCGQALGWVGPAGRWYCYRCGTYR